MDKKLQSVFSLASDGTTRDDHTTYDDFKRTTAGKTLASVFANNHANLTLVVMRMMELYDLKVSVATPFLDNEHKYLKTGEYDYAECEMMLVSSMLVCAVGSIEQLLVAALQIYYVNGKRNGYGKDYKVSYHNNEKETRCDVTIDFKFNEAKVLVKLEQAGDYRCISIYIDD